MRLVRLNRLDTTEKEYRQWIQTMNEYWRRADRDRNASDQDISDYLDDVWWSFAVYAQEQPVLLADNFFHFLSGFYAPGGPPHTVVLPWFERMMATGFVPSSLAMLSNYVMSFHAQYTEYAELEEKQSVFELLLSGVKTLQSLNTTHLWDPAWVYMASTLIPADGLTVEHPMLVLILQDANYSRLATRLACLIEHSPHGSQWWDLSVKTLQPQAAAGALSCPVLPDAHATISRKERDYQAWWRYTTEMQATSEYKMFEHWIEGLKQQSFETLNIPELM